MTGSASPRELLAAALEGDEDAFSRLIEPHRSELHAHSYRMLGSVHDAEDALQETFLKAWRGLAGFEDGNRVRPWLYKIATNVCLTAIKRRRRRVLPMDAGGPRNPSRESGEPLPLSEWVEPYPDERFGLEDGYAGPEAQYAQREAVELAFIAALQHLPARQRAVVIMREVLGFSAREVATTLETTVASVNSALQRARKTLKTRLPEQSQQATLRSVGDEQTRDLVERFIAAFVTGDVGAILALLTDDATFGMPPYPSWYEGREAIGESWLMPSGPPPRLRYVPTRANGQLALGVYLVNPDGEWLPLAIDVLTLRGDRICDVTAFRDTDLFGIFGVPHQLA